jgi:hypothetical protein
MKLYTLFVDLKVYIGIRRFCRLVTIVELSKDGFEWIIEDQIYLGRIKRKMQCNHPGGKQVNQRVFYARLLP